MWNTQFIGSQAMRIFRAVYTIFGLKKLSVRDTSWWESKFLLRRKLMRNILVPNERKINIFPCHSGHTHPRSAEFRSSANEFMINTVETAGYTPYVVSRSNRDRGDGSRYFYHPKDYHVEYRDDPVKADHCFVFTDVDYYADMNRWLMHWKPILMYTLVPKTLTHRDNEFAYYVDTNGILEYHVNGGASYQHPLWHYKGDTVVVIDMYGAMCIFDVEQREVEGDPHHRLIWLLPKARISYIGWIFDPSKWQNLFLQRLKVRNGNLDYLWDPVTDQMSVRGPGERYSVEIDGLLFHSIKARLANKDTPVRTSDIERMLGVGGYEKEKVRFAPLLLNCWDFTYLTPNILTTGQYQTNFSALPRQRQVYTEDAQQVGRAVTNPIVTNPALFAAKGHNADQSCIEGRVNKPRNNVDPGRKYYDYAREFVKLVVPDSIAGTGTPLDSAEVAEKQNGKLQKARFKDAIHGMSTMVNNQLKAFIKTEPYAAVNDPRNITTMSPELTINMSAYTIALATYLKKFKWYGVGKAPKKTIKRMRELAQLAGEFGLVPSDYGRFDGTVSRFLQEQVTLAIGLRWLNEEHRPAYKNYHQQVFKTKAVTAEGIKYDAGTGTRSGSPLTSFNTLKAAYISYSALRNQGHSSLESFEKLGINLGDDGNTPNWLGTYYEALIQASKDLGMNCESVVVPMGDPVPFAGRYFADPWHNDETFQDPIRTITKLHLSGNKGLTQEQAACNRAHGYLSTDSLTPIIGTYCERVLELCGNLRFKAGTHEEQFKCSNSWPQTDVQTILEAMAKVMDKTTDEILNMDSLVKQTAGLDQFPVILDSFVPAKCTAIVDGEVIGTGSHVSTNRFQQATENQQNDQPRASNRVVEQGPRQGSERPGGVLATNQQLHRPETSGTGQRGRNSSTNARANRGSHRKGFRAPPVHENSRRGGRKSGPSKTTQEQAACGGSPV